LRTVFGIGNPGHHYAANRHNVGFLILDYYASKKKIEFSPSKGEYFQASGSIGEIKFLLIKPTTYVNRSGIAAKEVFDSHNLEPEDILVICDDTNLNTGTLRVRLAGGDGGHNGLASIIYNLNSNYFPRIRIGVGQSAEKVSLADFVLSDFNENEIRKLQPAFENTILLIEEFISGGSKAMLDLNSKLSLDDRDNTNNL
jgi:PTH1 family peptidyl-tRNA hydrolase